MTLYLFKHSNYYNRILKRYDNINDYIENSILLGVYQNINFKPYDGVQTSLILNHQGETPDYIVCVDDSLAIDSRWYVVEDERLLNGQYRYTLLRDVIADYYNDVLTAPCFIEKALLKADDDLIFNPEQMSFNQIKKEEHLLKDKSQSTWLVGYVDREGETSSGSENISTDINYASDVVPENLVDIDEDYMRFILDNDRNPISLKTTHGIYNESFSYTIKAPLLFNAYQGMGVFQARYSSLKGNFSTVIGPGWSASSFRCEDLISDNTGGIPDIELLGSTCEFRGHVSGFPVLGLPTNVNNADEIAGLVLNNITQNLINNADINSRVKNLIYAAYAVNNSASGNVYTDGNINIRTVDYFRTNKDKIFRYIDGLGLVFYYKIKLTSSYVENDFLNGQPPSDLRLLIGTVINNSSGGYASGRDENGNSVSNIPYTSNIYYVGPSEEIDITNSTLNGNSDIGFSNGITVRLSKGNIIYSIEATQVYNNIQISFGNSEYRTKNESGIYDVFAIPLSDKLLIKSSSFGSDPGFYNNSLAAMGISQAIATELTTAKLYDLLILPYCPCPELIHLDENGNSYIDVSPDYITGKTVNFITSKVDEEVIPLSILIWCRESTYQDFIDSPINLNKINDPLLRKIDILTKKYRLCSPGYTSIYEFLPLFNNGILLFRYQIVFLPFNPYIRIAPVFDIDSLYGIDSQYDSKGLILKGDFQVPRTESPWETYLVNNKNYSEIYDREVLNLETTLSIERKMQVANAISGAVSGAVSGATTGAIASGGNPIGAVVGGLVGGAASAIGGALDVKYGDMLREEALDYKKDMFGMLLDNIKALPNSLTKSSPLSDNNPIWPILEVYDCTDREKKALRDKIEFNGMTVGVIGKISEYINNKLYYKNLFDHMYFKGRLIRLDTIYADSHIINAISNELNRGIYL